MDIIKWSTEVVINDLQKPRERVEEQSLAE